MTQTKRDHFAQIMKLADEELGPYAYKLYGHYVLRCGESPTRLCADTMRELATACQMALGKISSTRQELLRAGYIDIDWDDHVSIVDRWAENSARYGRFDASASDEVDTAIGAVEPSSDEQSRESVHDVNAVGEARSSGEQSVHDVNTPGQQRSSGEQSVHVVNGKRSVEQEQDKDKDSDKGKRETRAGARAAAPVSAKRQSQLDLATANPYIRAYLETFPNDETRPPVAVKWLQTATKLAERGFTPEQAATVTKLKLEQERKGVYRFPWLEADLPEYIAKQRREQHVPSNAARTERSSKGETRAEDYITGPYAEFVNH